MLEEIIRQGHFMAYQALYRKFRPEKFSDVRGQETIVTALKNQLKSGRIGHAYLFCGTRGTGKTSVAKIFAKAVNCSSPLEDGSPCGVCESCREIAAGSSLGVIEIDAASNNGVDNIRQIREEVEYSPTVGRYKVYIIDEAHMLSIGAFNALLKTLEEPPSYVIFILATTEIGKIPVTILSRCQRYDFHRMSADTMVERMGQLAKEEGMDVEKRALLYIARCANGSMRDALSLLDQCSAFYLGESITYDRALEVLGAVDTSVLSDFLEKIVREDVLGAMGLLEDIIMQGREIEAFIGDFTWHLRNLLLISAQDRDMQDVIDASSETIERLKEEAAMTSPDTIMRYIRIFSELSGEMRYSTQKRVLTEIALIKLMKPEMQEDVSSLRQRIESLEKKIERGDFISAKSIGISTAGTLSDEGKGALETKSGDGSQLSHSESDDKALVALPQDIKDVAKNWGKILSRLSKAGDGCRAALKNARPAARGDKLIIIFSDAFISELSGGAKGADEEPDLNFDFMSQEENKNTLLQAIEDVIGKKVDIYLEREKSGSREEGADYTELKGIINFDVEIIEEEK